MKYFSSILILYYNISNIYLKKGFLLAIKIIKTKNSVMKILKKIDTFIYEFGDKIL
jgi:hypothetical protein